MATLISPASWVSRGPSSGSIPRCCAASATARYIAPVSRKRYPIRSATSAPIVLFPAPAGPSIATVRGVATSVASRKTWADPRPWTPRPRSRGAREGGYPQIPDRARGRRRHRHRRCRADGAARGFREAALCSSERADFARRELAPSARPEVAEFERAEPHAAKAQHADPDGGAHPAYLPLPPGVEHHAHGQAARSAGYRNA